MSINVKTVKEQTFHMCRWFRFAQLAKGKSLGRSKPETNSSNEQAH